MADIAGSYSNHAYYPYADYTVSYGITARTATTITYKITVSYSITQDSGYGYGYDIQANYSIGGKTGSFQLKSITGALSGSANVTITCNTDASGGTLYAKIY